jgi:hypothetical protein
MERKPSYRAARRFASLGPGPHKLVQIKLVQIKLIREKLIREKLVRKKLVPGKIAVAENYSPPTPRIR